MNCWFALSYSYAYAVTAIAAHNNKSVEISLLILCSFQLLKVRYWKNHYC